MSCWNCDLVHIPLPYFTATLPSKVESLSPLDWRRNMSAPWIVQFPTGQTQLVFGTSSNLASYVAPNGPLGSDGWSQLWGYKRS